MLKYLLIKLKKNFECFICCWKWFYSFVLFSFCSKCIFVFFFKNWFRGLFARSLRLKASHEMCLREISKVTFSYRKSRYCLVSISRLNPSHEMIFRQKLEKYKFHTEAIVTVLRLKASHETSVLQWCFSQLISRLPNPRKTRVFSFIRLMWQFLNTLYFPHLPSLEPFSTQN